jgi:competence protein ComEC
MSLLLASVALARPDGRLHVAILDVGQGDSILLQGPSGGRMLIDTGPDPERLLALLDSRIPAWDRRLDLVVLTHPHEDHVGGLALLLERYRIGDVVEPGMIGPGPGDAAYRRELASLGRTSRVVAAGDTLWLDGIELDVDWPRRGSVPLRPPDAGTGINNVSIVLELHFGQRRMLFTGDVEEQIDPQLLASGIAAHIGGQLDLLKVAHHGSGTATTDAFVEQLDPRVAVISAGWGNPYGHPSPKTVKRLEDHGAKLFRTDLDGNVDVSTDGTDLTSTAEGGRPHDQSRLPGPTQLPQPAIGFCPIDRETAGRRGRRTYNRPRDRSLPPRRGEPSRVAVAEREAADTLRGGRRGRRVPCHAHDPPRRGC